VSNLTEEMEEADSTASAHLSWSAVTCYRTCPLKYFFRYVAGIKEESVSASLLFGGAIHRALARYFTARMQGLGDSDLDSLLDDYQIHWDQHRERTVHYSGSDSQGSLLATARRMLACFLESPLARLSGQVTAVEERLSGIIVPGLPAFVGVVDLIVRTPSELMLVDWKTSRGRWSELQLAEAQEQLLLYAQLAQDMAPGKQISLQPVVLTKCKVPAIERYLLPFDPLKLQRTKSWIAALWRAIQGRHYYPTPSAAACATCPFRERCRDWRGLANQPF
jgi:CRISPR/Cas system-associated exonuclease Cas4 (RecB family)